jgi:hypothetical protein
VRRWNTAGRLVANALQRRVRLPEAFEHCAWINALGCVERAPMRSESLGAVTTDVSALADRDDLQNALTIRSDCANVHRVLIKVQLPRRLLDDGVAALLRGPFSTQPRGVRGTRSVVKSVDRDHSG